MIAKCIYFLSLLAMFLSQIEYCDGQRSIRCYDCEYEYLNGTETGNSGCQTAWSNTTTVECVGECVLIFRVVGTSYRYYYRSCIDSCVERVVDFRETKCCDDKDLCNQATSLLNPFSMCLALVVLLWIEG